MAARSDKGRQNQNSDLRTFLATFLYSLIVFAHIYFAPPVYAKYWHVDE